MNLTRLAALIAVTMTLFACEQNKSLKYAEAEIPVEHKEDIANTIEANEPGFEKEFQTDTITQRQLPGDRQKQPSQQAGQPPAKQDWDKKIIKTATLNLETKDFNAFSGGLRKKISEFGGYIAQEEQRQTEYKIENIITVKVPVDQFDNAVADITAGAEKIHEKKINSQDVTTEVIDVRSRMEAKKQARTRYMDLLKQARNMEDILHVQTQINGIQEEIEAASGRIRYLGHSTVFSTIQLTYYQVLDATAGHNENPSFGQQFKHAVTSGLSWVRDLFIALVSIWPLFLIAFIVYGLYKRSKVNKPTQA